MKSFKAPCGGSVGPRPQQPAPAQGQAGPASSLYARDNLFDSKSGKLLDNQIVLVKDDKIAAAGPAESVQIPSDAQVIDLSKSTVLPGLIDGHTPRIWVRTRWHQDWRTSLRQSRLTTRANIEPCLLSPTRRKTFARGFTTLRDLMSHGGGYADVDIKKAINRGYFQGPRMQVVHHGACWQPAKASWAPRK